MIARASVLVASLVVAAIWCVICAGTGARLRRLARTPLPVELALPIDFLLGAWAVAVATLAAGLAGLFTPPILAGIVAGAAIFAASWRFGGRRRLRRTCGWRRRSTAFIALPSIVLLPVALAPPFFYDAMVYHLGLPWQALQEGRLAPHAENLFAAFPPLAQLVNAAPLAIGLERVPALLHLACFIAAGVVVATMARRLGAPASMARLAGGALPLLPAVVLVAGLPAAEGWMLAPIFAALAVVLWSEIAADRDRRSRRFDAAVVGLLCGIGCAARLQGIAWSAIVLAALALRSRARLRDVPLAAAGWIAGSAPWWLKNLILLGDPVAPIGWRREGMETLWRDAGSLMHAGSGVSNSTDVIGASLASQIAYAGPLLLATLLAVARGRDPRTKILIGVVLAGVVAWAATGTLPRFLAPTIALVLVGAAAAGGTKIGAWAGGAALIVTLALGLAFTVREISRWGGPAMAFEEISSDERGAVTNSPAGAFAESKALPEGARLLFVGEARGYRFPRPFVAPSQHDVSPLREPIETLHTAEGARAWLRDRGFTHLLVNVPELQRLSRNYPVAPWRTDAGRARFEALLRDLAPAEIQRGGVSIFKL